MPDAEGLCCRILHSTNLVLACEIREPIFKASDSYCWLLLGNTFFDRILTLQYWLKRLFKHSCNRLWDLSYLDAWCNGSVCHFDGAFHRHSIFL